jgi:hypothetical protein
MREQVVYRPLTHTAYVHCMLAAGEPNGRSDVRAYQRDSAVCKDQSTDDRRGCNSIMRQEQHCVHCDAPGHQA